MSKVKPREYSGVGVNAMFIRKLLVKRAASRVYLKLNDEPEREVPRNATDAKRSITVQGVRVKAGDLGFSMAMETFYRFMQGADVVVSVFEDGSVHIRAKERGKAQ